jgi:CO/xanthine dehydrogenase Mo-binding subunit
MYLNLDNGRGSDQLASQAWVVVSMEAEGRFSVDFDATSLGNGCSPAADFTAENGSFPAIGPAPNVNPRAFPNQ